MPTLIDHIRRLTRFDYCTDSEITVLLGEQASPDKRYGLVKRALARNELIRLKRGLYCLGPDFRRKKLNSYVAAQLVYSPSYVSLESALGYHRLIPEAVYSITSVSTRRKARFDTPIGVFEYFSVPARVFQEGVLRVEDGEEAFLIASPLKAILDYVYVHKKEWNSASALSADLRIDDDFLDSLSREELERVGAVFCSKRISRFVKMLTKGLRS